MRFWSRDWLGHSRTLKCFLRSHSFIAQAVCLGSLLCWKTKPHLIFIALANRRKFLHKISQHMVPFITSLTRIDRPVPFAEKPPESMMCPPRCFTLAWDATPHSSSSKYDRLSFYKNFYFCFFLPHLPIFLWIIHMATGKL